MDRDAEEAAIRANADKYVESYNRRDSKTMASMWSPDAIYMDPTHRRRRRRPRRDRQAVRLRVRRLRGCQAGRDDRVDRLRLAQRGDREGPGDRRPIPTFLTEVTDYTAVHVKRDGQWLLDRVSEVEEPPPPPSHYEQLKELEWMVGSWIDDDEGDVIQTDCEWTKNRELPDAFVR